MENTSTKILECPVLSTLDVIAGKWKTRTLWLLREGPLSFGEIKRGLPGISAKVLTAQLVQLEKDGIIERDEQVTGNARRVFYSYSAYGETLIPALNLLGRWGVRHKELANLQK